MYVILLVRNILAKKIAASGFKASSLSKGVCGKL